jgi:hypothetical protein
VGIPERVTVKDVERVLVTETDLVRVTVTDDDGQGDRDRVRDTEEDLVNNWVEGIPECDRDNEVVRVRLFVIVCDTVAERLFVIVGDTVIVFEDEEVYCRDVGKGLNVRVTHLEIVGLPLIVFESVASDFDAVCVKGKVVGTGLFVKLTDFDCVTVIDGLIELIGELDAATVLLRLIRALAVIGLPLAVTELDEYTL